jgi:hypothetical protein
VGGLNHALFSMLFKTWFDHVLCYSVESAKPQKLPWACCMWERVTARPSIHSLISSMVLRLAMVVRPDDFHGQLVSHASILSTL